MISAIIATFNSERPLVQTLSALVPAAVEGLVREVIVVDRGSRDHTALVADDAGCSFMVAEGALGRSLKTAAEAARAPWLLFLRPGIVIEAAWIGEARRFTERSAAARSAAVFRRGAQTAPREFWIALAGALGALPRRDQGLLIGRPFYDALGGHSESAADPEGDLIRRIGRRRLVTLAAAASGESGEKIIWR